VIGTGALTRATREEIETFLFDEAEIADMHRYEEWLALWEPDAIYWIPCNDDDADPETHVALAYETYTGLEDRVHRLAGGWAHTQSPQSRISRVISNVRFAQAEDGLVTARSVFNLTAFRRHRVDIFAGRQSHVLRRRTDGAFGMVRKTVYLVNNDGYMTNMTFLV
jgi:benzoate/toluate 1,2-dioxygenase subunit beta